MSATHTVTVGVEHPDGDDFTTYSFRFACTGDASSKCHQWCAEGCEEECAGYGVHRWSATAYSTDGTSCRVVDWLDACGAEDTYAGDDEPHQAGTRRIEDEWTGDDYVWRYWDIPGA